MMPISGEAVDVGRPPHTPEPAIRRQVEAMAGYGVPEADIARVIGIDAKTLRKHYRQELDLGHIKANTNPDFSRSRL